MSRSLFDFVFSLDDLVYANHILCPSAGELFSYELHLQQLKSSRPVAVIFMMQVTLEIACLHADHDLSCVCVCSVG